MKTNKKSGIKIVSVIIMLGFVIGVGIIMLFPFDNRNLRIEFLTSQESYLLERSNEEVISEVNTTFEFSDIDEMKIKQIKVYGNFLSSYLKKINYSEISKYIQEIPGGEMQICEGGILFSGSNNISLVMNESFQEELRNLSASFLQERLWMCEILLVFCGIALIICKLIEEKSSGNNHGPVYEAKKFLGDLKKYGQYMIYAAKTDLKAEVANSYLNRLWWLLEPLFSMLVYVIVFGQVLGRGVDNYAAFIFSTLLMWNFFNKTLNYSVKLVRTNRDILSKVYVPKFIILLSNMFLNLFKLFFSMIILVIMLFVFRIEIGINIIWVIPAYAGLILLAFGTGMIFLHFGVYVDDLAYAVTILLHMLMYLSGVFYEAMATLPAPLNTILMCLNPIAIYLDTMRNALLYNTVANLPFLGIWLVISFILCCIGIHIVYKNENGYVKVV